MRCATLVLLAQPLAAAWLPGGMTHARQHVAPRSALRATASIPDPAAAASLAESGAEEAPAQPDTKPGGPSLPPSSFGALLDQAAGATAAAMRDGQLLMEVEFPPLPTSTLENTAVSSYDLLAANLQFALEFAKRLSRELGTSPTDGKSIALTLPDAAERVRAAEFLGCADDDETPQPGMRMWSLSGGDAKPSPLGVLSSLFKQSSMYVQAAPWASAYLVLGASAQELPALGSLAEAAPDAPIITFNIGLDTLRGDLGLPAFPPRRVHHEVLSRFKAVYYMRPRSYTLSLARPPFLLSYAGVLFRTYPEGFQTLLDKGSGTYRQVGITKRRPALGAFKAELAAALKVDDEAARASISQAGYKQSTWWEDDKDGQDVSDDWRL